MIAHDCKGQPHILCERCGGFHPAVWKCDRGPCCELDRATRRAWVDTRRAHDAASHVRRSHAVDNRQHGPM